MATLREYFETDFGNAIRLSVSLDFQGESIEGAVLYDVQACTAFVAWYVAGLSKDLDYFLSLANGLLPAGPVPFAGHIRLPAAKTFHGLLQFQNGPALGVRYQLFGDPLWRDVSSIASSGRIFLYAESQLPATDVERLQSRASLTGLNLQFRSTEYVDARNRLAKPLAFICHDSRDKDAVAREIATSLQRFMCPVWYDEFSLNVGDRLRDSIEKGLKECKKCVLVLSSNFFSNRGWTKREFDSIFTRELLEDAALVLPVWYGVNREQVFEYSPSLANVVGLDWQRWGCDEVCRRLQRAIDP